MKPLSIFTYYLNNKRKVIPVIIMIALSVLGITATAAFTGAINRDIETQFTFYDHFYIAELKSDKEDPGGENMRKFQDRIRESQLTEGILTGEIRGVRTNSIIGDGFAFLYFLTQQNQSKFMETMQWELVNGRMPLQNNEIAITMTLLKTTNKNIGDSIGNEIDSEDLLPGKYTIVGEISAGNAIASGIGFIGTNKQTVTFIKPLREREQELDEYLRSIANEFSFLDIRTNESERVQLDKEFQTLDMILWALNAITILVIAISVGLINIIFFMQRANEFGLLAAIGYSRSFLIRKTFMESIGMVALGWVLGILCAEGVYAILNRTIFQAAVSGLTVFNARVILFSLPVPIAVIFFSCITVLWKLLKFDAIEIIEKRD